MKHLPTVIIAILALLAVTVVYAFTTDKDSNRISNAMAKQGMGAPEYLTIEETLSDSYMVKYGLGGRTCKSIVKINNNNVITDEIAKRCS